MRAGGLALAVASTFACVLAAEAGARIFVRRLEARPHTQRSFLEYDPELGWRKAAGAEVWLHGEGPPVLFRTNSQGLRGPERAYPNPRGATRVLLLGDSYTEAGAVEEEASVRAVLERMLNTGGTRSYEVLNAGTSGYSTDQEYLFFEKEGARYGAGTVVLLFFSNDLQGNTATKKKPWFEEGEGNRLVLRGSPVPAPPEDRRRRSPDPPPHFTPWRGSMALRLLGLRTERGHPALHRWLSRLGLVEPAPDHAPTRDWLQVYGPPSELTERRWRLTLSLIDALRASVSARGGDIVVFYVPAGFEIDERDWQRTRQRWSLAGEGWDASQVARRLAAACEARGVPFVDPRPALRQAQAAGRAPYFRDDPHWTAVGHEAAAEALLPVLSAYTTRTGGADGWDQGRGQGPRVHAGVGGR